MHLTLGETISLATRWASRSDLAASEVSQLANLALMEVSTRVYHTPKEETAISNVTGTGNERYIALPTDFDGIVALKFYSTSTDPDTGINTLGASYDLDIADTPLLDSFSSTSGLPQRYAIYGSNVEVDPIPNSRGSFVMRYLAKQPTLVLSAATPNIDERWHLGWVWKTTEFVHRARGNVAGAEDARREYFNYMTTTPHDRATEQMAKKGLGLWLRRS